METAGVNSFLIALARSSIEAGILVVLVLVTQWVFQKQLTARWRCALWFVVVARLLLPFSFSSVTSVFNLLPRWTPPVPPVSVGRSMPTVTALQNQPASSSDSAPPFEPMDSIPPIGRHTWSWSWPGAIFATWLAGVILLAGYVAVLSFRFRRRCAGLRPVGPGAVQDVLDDCCARLRVRIRPALLESVEVSSPALYGLFGPRLLLPRGFTATFSLVELRFVFLHELAHLKRRDLPVNWVMTAVQVLHWFNPLVWFAFASWRADRELACDAMALEAAGQEQNKDYGRTILRLLESFTHPIKTPGLVGILEDKRQLRRRIGMIASYVPTRGWPRLALLLIGVLAVIGLTDAKTSSRFATVSQTGQIQSLNEKLIEQKKLCIKLEKELVEFQTIEATNPTELAYVLVTVNPDDTLSGLLDKLRENQYKLANETSSLALAGPGVVSTRELIDALQKEIKDRVTEIMHGLEAQVEAQVVATEGQQVTIVVPSSSNPSSGSSPGVGQAPTVSNPNPVQQKDDAMNKSKIAAPAIASLLALATPATIVNLRGESTPPPTAAQPYPGDELTGAWVWVAAPGYQAPPDGANFKFFTGSHWCTTHPDARTGVVIYHHGGTYHVKGNEYDESVDYADPITMDRIGHHGRFTIQIRGDMLTNIGIDNGWRQVWKRLEPDAATAKSPLARKLTGAWVKVSEAGNAAPDGNGPGSGKLFKLCADGHWCDTYSDPKNGVVVIHHGGTYTIKGNTYSETVDYANPGTMDLIGHTFKFGIKFQGDTLSASGIGNPWKEVWKRVD